MTTKAEMSKIAERLKPIIAKYEVNVVYNGRDRKKVEQVLHDCFAEIYVLVHKEVGTSLEEILDVDWNEVLYHKDGKTLQDRLDSHYEVYNNSPKTLEDRLVLSNKLARIVRAEAKHITNTAMFYAIKDKAKFLVVCGEDTGIDCDCFANWGTFPVKDFDATTMLPPFHPDCECSFYAIIDEEEEI